MVFRRLQFRKPSNYTLVRAFRDRNICLFILGAWSNHKVATATDEEAHGRDENGFHIKFQRKLSRGMFRATAHILVCLIEYTYDGATGPNLFID